MAYLELHKSGVYRVRFRFSGRQYYRSLDTGDEVQAQTRKGQVEETLALLKRGIITLPPNVSYEQAGDFILTGGKPLPVQPVEKPTFAEVVAIYLKEMPEGAKEPSSLLTERIHLEHLKRLLGGSEEMEALGVAEIQHYVLKRSREAGAKGKRVSPDTIRKELQTFGQVWNFAKSRGWVRGENPKRAKLPKREEKPPFQTWEEIEKATSGLRPDVALKSEMWDRLFLDEGQVLELLEHVKAHAAYPFVLPLVAFPAFTGARRSEVIASEVSDWDFARGIVLIREKKRKHSLKLSFRSAPILPQLATIMREWFNGQHPSGRFAICSKADEPLTDNAAHHHFHHCLAESKWKVLKGFHTLRHSFISICAMRGTPQSVISSWVGHETPEMEARYRHLFPQQVQAAAANLFK